MATARSRQASPRRIGRYRLVSRLGGGGMGVVYLAEKDKGGPVALKVIRPELADDKAFRARFRREVEAASRVRGACIARVLDAEPDGNPPYLVTEYVPGPTLQEHVERHGPLVPGHARAFGLALAEALVAIHEADLVHRDLKPSNVLLTEDGPRVIDFGIARAADATAITQTGVSIGTPAWMSPEQARGQEAGAAADTFSWGALVSYASTGRPPFGLGAADAVLYRVVHEKPDLTGLDPSLKPLVASV